MNTAIKAWLDAGAKDYDAGTALFDQYGKNPNLKRLFSKKDDYYCGKKLAWELNRLLHTTTASKAGHCTIASIHITGRVLMHREIGRSTTTHNGTGPVLRCLTCMVTRRAVGRVP